MNDESIHPVILFDGVCNLCNSIVQFVITHDKKRLFRFASLQSNFGQQVLQQFQLPQNNFNSFIVLDNNRIYTQSSAAFKIVKQLNGLWKLLYIFIIVPPFIRNAVYSFIAKNRYKWFGKKEECRLPTPELKELFIE